MSVKSGARMCNIYVCMCVCVFISYVASRTRAMRDNHVGAHVV